MSFVGFESTRSGWQNPTVFDVYKQNRELSEGLFESLVAEAFLPAIQTNAQVVEIGAGNGVLYDTLADQLPDTVNWTETDQTVEYLLLARPAVRQLVAVELPFTPFADNSVDAVVGLSSLDTLSPPVLEAALAECKRILVPGGSIVHALDLAPNIDALVKEALRNGYIPFPCSLRDNEESAGSGVHFVQKRRLAMSLLEMKQDVSIKRIFQSFIQNYENTFAQVGINYPAVFDVLALILEEGGLVEKTVPLWEYFSTNMVQAADAAGLRIVRNEVIKKQALIERNKIKQEITPEANMISRLYGVRAWANVIDDASILDNMVKVRSNILLHQFQTSSD